MNTQNHLQDNVSKPNSQIGFQFIVRCLFPWAILACLFILSQGCGSKQEKRPNILFIFSDDHAFQAISAYGSIINETPHIDRLAREGMLFNRCYVTNSICAPSRAVILTGKYSHLNGVATNRDTFDGKQQSFPKLLQQAGYQTALVGKWHLKTEPQGFDYSEVLPGQGVYYNPDMIKNGVDTKHEGYTTEIITDLAVDWLESKRDPQKPFMLMLQQKAPHRPWDPGPDYLSLYDDITIPEPETLFDDYSGRGSQMKMQEITILRSLQDRDMKLTVPDNLTDKQREAWEAAYNGKNEAFRRLKLEGKDLLSWKYQRYIKDYLRCVAALDDNIGRVLQYLDDAGLSENTVVVYASDQGFYLGEHGLYDKRLMHEESLRTPFMVRWPGVISPGTINEDIVSNIDFAQTFLDIAGALSPTDMQGQSLVPLLRGLTPKNWRTRHYYHYYQNYSYHNITRHEGVTDGRYKLINYYDLGEWEFYDLQKDPREMQSMYNNSGYKEIIAELKTDMGKLREQYQIPPIEPLTKTDP